MAFPSTFLLITLLSIAFAVSSTQGISLGGGILGGVITCTNTSVAVAGTYNVIPQAKVDLVCGSGSVTQIVKSTVTNTAGVYYFVFTSLDTILNDPGKCFLLVTLPTNTCIFNIPNGVLRIPIVVLSTVDALVGKLLILVPGALSYVLSH
ncbi:unnamed protein product [Fraxinus pennsylvanica]|uniref:Pollen Ole e 1 allergen and extensin family protein n=1 Tax=Fraxinus pennsylvanica TaxID=56036 RepID=A0AAD2E5U1_9LAMI|nr:unnamed protein product [Fraxinus pennsylvanica]